MTKYSVKVIANASRDNIELVDQANIKMHITKVPEKGKANKHIIKLLAKHFKCSKAAISIVNGELSAHKIIEINQES